MLLETRNRGLSAKYQHQTHAKWRISNPFFAPLFVTVLKYCQHGSAETGPGGIFENMDLSVVDMRSDLSGLSPGSLEWFATVLDARMRPIYKLLSPTPRRNLPQRPDSHYEILTTSESGRASKRASAGPRGILEVWH